MAYSKYKIWSFVRSKLDTNLFIVLIFIHTFTIDGVTSWTYGLDDSHGGPQAWSTMYPNCSGNRQSPVAIDTRKVIYDPSLQLFDFSDYSRTDGLMLKLKNFEGHTAKVIISGIDLLLKNGSLPGTFKLFQLHFHWGANNRRGSEHIINRRRYPLEVHFVHRMIDPMGSGMMNITQPQSLAVVGFLFKAGKNWNQKYNQLLQYLELIINPNDEVQIPTFAISDLLPVSKRYHYFRYQGSLTTPPCYETVIWSVALNKIFISKDQLRQFRRLMNANNNHMVDCFRPVQDTNNRTIYTTKKQRQPNL